jgi:hypothetical protein
LLEELCRDGAELKKHTVVDACTYGEDRPSAGECAVLAAMSLLANAMPLRPCDDRLTVRVPIEWEAASDKPLVESNPHGRINGNQYGLAHVFYGAR